MVQRMKERESKRQDPIEKSRLIRELRKIALQMLGIGIFFTAPFSIVLLIALGIVSAPVGYALLICVGIPLMVGGVFLTDSQFDRSSKD